MPKALTSRVSITVPVDVRNRIDIAGRLSAVCGGATDIGGYGSYVRQDTGETEVEHISKVEALYDPKEISHNTVLAVLAQIALDVLETGEESVLLDFPPAGALIYDHSESDLSALRKIAAGSLNEPTIEEIDHAFLH